MKTEEKTTYAPGTLAHQFRAVPGVILDPTGAFTSLPADQLYPLAVLIPVLVGLGKLVQNAGWGNVFGSLPRTLGWLAFAVFMQFVIAWVVQLVVRSFGKRLGYLQSLNIFGYSQVPGLLGVAVTLSVAGVPLPADPDKGSMMHAMAMLVGLGMSVYSLLLLVHGLRQAPPVTVPPPDPQPSA